MSKSVTFLKNTIKYITSNHVNDIKHPANINTISKILDKVPSNIQKQITKYKSDPKFVPIVIGGKEYDINVKQQKCPYDHETTIANYSTASTKIINNAIETSMKGREIMRKMNYQDKLKIFQKTASLCLTTYSDRLFASTIVGQAKTFHQADIDAICELVDFINYDIYYLNEMNKQTWHRQFGEYNLKEWNPLNGFVGAITPFNFTAIGAHLSFAPALMGNGVLWKPSDYSVLSNFVFYEAMLEAGMPPEVISFIPADGDTFIDAISVDPNFSGLAFTGSSEVFQNIYQQVGDCIHRYNSFPRIVGETGGNNFHFVFPDANIEDAAYKTIRGAFEYSGQKCSATGRLYLPRSIYQKFVDEMTKNIRELIIDSPEVDNVFTSAVIHKKSYLQNEAIIKEHWNKKGFEILYGGMANRSEGYYIHPTIIECDNPFSELMCNENFGPILSLYVYDDDNIEDIEKAVQVCSSTGKYGLTGAVFTNSMDYLKMCYPYFNEVTGNFYINDKSTGSVVGKQPFGGSKLSGTNDKAGGEDFLKRFGNNRIIKVV